MLSSLFPSFFEISCIAVTLTLAAETGWFFAERFLYHRQNLINFTAFAASLMAAVYTTYKLVYFFLGVGDERCEEFKIVTGLFQGLSNSLAFLHLFLRANVINSTLSINPYWKQWKWLGIILTVAYWLSLFAVAFVPTSKKGAQEDGMHCILGFEPVSFTSKWIIQLVSHVVFSTMFVYPLITHIFAIRRIDTQRRSDRVNGFSRSNAAYNRLVWRAVAAMAASTLFTGVITVFIFIHNAHPTLEIPLVALSILDNGLTLGSIYFANGGSPTAWDRDVNVIRLNPPPASNRAYNGDRETWQSLSPQSPLDKGDNDLSICLPRPSISLSSLNQATIRASITDW